MKLAQKPGECWVPAAPQLNLLSAAPLEPAAHLRHPQKGKTTLLAFQHP